MTEIVQRIKSTRQKLKSIWKSHHGENAIYCQLRKVGNRFLKGKPNSKPLD